MEVPADGLLIESNEITTDESAMTGETDPVVKNLLSVCTKKRNPNSVMSESEVDMKPVHSSPIIMSGTRVLTGSGKMVIIVVGPESCLGKIRSILEQ
jgi:magnesium-transporting ATPase (P-type)